MDLGRLSLTAVIMFSLLGTAIALGLKWPKLPGDIIIHKPGFIFAFPFTSSIIISIILTFLLDFIFKR
ncbi:MAG: DUF2905 family protein [Candidatus Woykebacteria bacterium]